MQETKKGQGVDKLWDKNPPVINMYPRKETVITEKKFRLRQFQSAIVQCKNKECQGWMHYSQPFCSWCGH